MAYGALRNRSYLNEAREGCTRRILISGAGVAGLSAGIDLAAAGQDVTIVERATHLRVNGSPIDIRGESIGIAAKMGILDQIRAHRVDMTESARFVGSHGEVLAELPDNEIGPMDDDTEIRARTSPTSCATRYLR